MYLVSIRILNPKQRNHIRSFVSHQLTTAMTATFAPPHSTVTERFGMRSVKMPAATLWATYSQLLFLRFVVIHERFFCCSSAKLTRTRLLVTIPSVPASAAPCIDAPTAQPTKQSNQ